MSATRSLLAKTLSAVCAAALAVSFLLPAAASPAASSPALATLAFHVRATAARRAGCVKGAAHGARRARTSASACRTKAQRLRVSASKKTHAVKTRQSKHSAATVPTPAAEAEAALAPPSTATIAAVLDTPCQNTELTPEAGNIPLVRAAVLCLINHKRAENGERPLVISSELEGAAEGHCEELIADDYFAHVSPSGETPVDRIRGTGYIPNADVGYVIGENLAWGTYNLSTPESIVSAWFASPGHLANILEAQYRDTGIGVTPAVPSSLAPGAPGATYAQEFGVIIQ